MTAKDFARETLAAIGDPYGERRQAARNAAEIQRLRTQLATMVDRTAVADWLEAEAARLDANGIEPNDFAQRLHAMASWARNPGMDFEQVAANARRLADEAEAESHRSFNELGEFD